VIKRHYIDSSSGGQIHFADVGSGVPILFLHQTPRSWDEFREVMERLQNQAYCIALDLPGMGASDPSTSNDGIEDYAAAAIELIEHLNLGPMTVCGHHTGGVVAIEIAAKRPDLVSSLVLSSTPWTRKTKSPIDTVAVSRDGQHLLGLWKQRSPYYPDDAAYLMRFMTNALQANDPAHGHNAITDYQMERVAEHIDCNVLVIEHSKDPFSAKYTDLLTDNLAVSRVEKIADGMVPLEVSSKEVAAILTDWLLQQA